MNYPQRQFRGPRQGGYRGPRSNGGQNVQGGYKPNSGKLDNNQNKVEAKHPDMKGVMNVVTPDGRQESYFISAWWNQDGSLGLKMTHVSEANQGQGQPRQNGGYRPQGQYRQPPQQYGGPQYDQQPQPYNSDPYQHPQNGAMSRARPIPPAQYVEQGHWEQNVPPPNSYPENAGQYDENGDEIPF